MKKLLSLLLAVNLLFLSSCNAQQKLMQTVNDAGIIKQNEKKFIGKPFKDLLSEIEPEIKYAYGTPDYATIGVSGGQYIKFFFTQKDSAINIIRKDLPRPTSITVTFMPDKSTNLKPIPIGGISIDRKELVRLYGNMIVARISVFGSN
ncbi:MAG: hypothetical protein ABIN48_12555 [Ginsengibacter sp.]